tara:strand:- start:1 stop:213 length:213 start_codon:yes stop_codon:yes gene_type:complete
MKDIDIEISDKDTKIDTDKTDFPVEKFMKTLEAIDWKLWEILQLLQGWDKDEDEEEIDEADSVDGDNLPG